MGRYLLVKNLLILCCFVPRVVVVVVVVVFGVFRLQSVEHVFPDRDCPTVCK